MEPKFKFDSSKYKVTIEGNNICIYDKVATKEDWVVDMYHKYERDSDVNSVLAPDKGDAYVFNNKTLKMTKSHCADSDKFDSKTGIAIAYAKLIGEKIPDSFYDVGFDRKKFYSKVKAICKTSMCDRCIIGRAYRRLGYEHCYDFVDFDKILSKYTYTDKYLKSVDDEIDKELNK